MVRLLIALMLAALPVTAHSATIVTYTGSGPGSGYEYDSIADKWTPYVGSGNFFLSFDTDNFCYFGVAQCGYSGDMMTAHYESYHEPTNHIALKFDHPLVAFPPSPSGFSGGTFLYEYGGPASYFYFEGNLNQLDVTISDGPSMPFAQFGISISARAVAVPEPASWAMLILGIGAIGAAMRRRRNEAFLAA